MRKFFTRNTVKVAHAAMILSSSYDMCNLISEVKLYYVVIAKQYCLSNILKTNIGTGIDFIIKNIENKCQT